MTAAPGELRPAVPGAPEARPEFITAVAGIARALGLGPDWCRSQSLSQPENRESWERIASALEAQQARAGFRLIKGGAR